MQWHIARPQTCLGALLLMMAPLMYNGCAREIVMSARPRTSVVADTLETHPRASQLHEDANVPGLARRWQLAGDENDTTLLDPRLQAVSVRFVAVVDQGANKIVLIDARSGQVIRAFGTKGRGPGELLGVMGIAFLGVDTLAVFDAANVAIKLFTVEGKWIRNIRAQLASANGACSAGGGLSVLATVGRREVQIVPHDSTAATFIDRIWPGDVEEDALRRQQLIATDYESGTCYTIKVYDGRISELFGSKIIRRAELYSGGPEPVIRTKTSGSRKELVKTVEGEQTASGFCVSRDFLIVLRQSSPSKKGLDIFAKHSLRFLASVPISKETAAISCAGTFLTTLSYSDGLTSIEGYELVSNR